MTRSLRLEHVLMGSQTTADPEDHPRWDGERIRPYGTDAEPVMWDDDNGWEDEQA